MKENLKQAIVKYKAAHPRIVTANFEGRDKQYEIEQPGLDIIEALEKIVAKPQPRYLISPSSRK